jgi:hypothetical protein
MVAITHTAHRPSPPRRTLTATTYRRRRLLAAALVVLLLVSLVNVASALAGREGRQLDNARPVAELSVLVEPGDTVWSVAESLAGGDDVRPVVDAIVAANGGADLQPGERLLVVLP